MKILILNSRDAGGGAAGIARDIADGYVAAGHEVHWLVGLKTRRADPTVTEVAPLFDRGPLRYLGVQAFRCFGGGRASAPLARMRWRRLLQNLHARSVWTRFRGREDFHLGGSNGIRARLPWRPDLIHAHNLHGFNHLTHFDLRLLPLLSFSAPTLVTLHDPWLMTGHCAHFFSCERWKSGCGDCPDLRTYPRIPRDATAENWRAKREIYSRSRLHVAGVCDWITHLARASILNTGLASSRTIYNGVKTSLFTPLFESDRAALRSELDLSPSSFVAVYASELGLRNPYRDFTTMREACERLAVALAPRPVVAVELGGDVAQSTTKNNLTVRELGFVPHRVVIQYLQAGDALLHAAVADTSPTIIYEAMSCGLPAIATGICGIPEQIVDGETGFLIANNTVSVFVQKLQNIAKDPALRERFSGACVRRARGVFSTEAMIANYLATVTALAAGV